MTAMKRVQAKVLFAVFLVVFLYYTSSFSVLAAHGRRPQQIFLLLHRLLLLLLLLAQSMLASLTPLPAFQKFSNGLFSYIL